MITIKNYINGKLKEPINKQWINGINPGTGEVYGKLPNSDYEDVALAYKAAHAAFTAWSKTPIEKRSQILSKIADLIEEKLDDLAVAESLDNGRDSRDNKSG